MEDNDKGGQDHISILETDISIQYEEVEVVQHEKHIQEEPVQQEGELTWYPSGPYDIFVLTRYRHNVSKRLWFAQECSINYYLWCKNI